MMHKSFFVVDTNFFISANLIEKSISAEAYDTVLKIGKIAISDKIVSEYMEVLYRQKLDKYLDELKRETAMAFILKNSISFKPMIKINKCRDPKDNKFLELALTCNAACIISGDKDLLVLNPFRNIPILNPSDFLSIFKHY